MSTPSTLVAGRYRLIKLLGAGGMGVVWQAWDERLERPVALKMLRTQPELTEREREVTTARAMREARINAGLQRRHAVTVFDVVEHDGQPCLVMQLVESTPLSVLLREHGTMTPTEVARIGAEVSSALAAAHKMRIVHRDVKPGNILITEDGSAMISDFGISYALGDATITATGMIHGTPAYLAPEVARGKPSSFASDVFSLGSTMYAMLEGDPPFGADKNAIALLHRVARGGFAAPKRAGALAPLLRQMLSADPKRRPTMTAIAASLSQIKDADPSFGGAVVDGVAAVATEVLPAATAETSPLEDLFAETPENGESGAAQTERLAEAGTTEVVADAAPEPGTAAHPGTALIVPLPEPVDREAPTKEASTLQAAPGKTTPMDQLTRFEPPTAETEPLGAAASRHPLPAQVPPRPRLPVHPVVSRPPVRRGRIGAGIVVALVVAAVVIGAVLMFGPFRQDIEAAGPTPTQTSEATETTPSPEPTSPPAVSTPAPEPVVQTPPAVTPEQRVVQAITNYYALMPGNRDTAWPLMTADYQQNHAGGRGNYDAFWSAIAGVQVADVTASAPDQAQATLIYTYNDGSVSTEVTAFRLVDEGGVLKIAATEVL